MFNNYPQKMAKSLKMIMKKINFPNTERLCFELLDKTNADHLFEMFEADSSTYFINNFKTKKMTMEYVSRNLNYGKYFGYDMLIKHKETSEYVGIFYIYDISSETFNDNHKKCTIGFALKKAARGKYIMHEALYTLIRELGKSFNMILCYTSFSNAPAIKLIENLGFVAAPDTYVYDYKFKYYEWSSKNVTVENLI